MGSNLNIFWTCNSCGAQVPGNQLECPKCTQSASLTAEPIVQAIQKAESKVAEELSPQKPGNPTKGISQQLVCNHCGKANSLNSMFCIQCDSPFIPSHSSAHLKPSSNWRNIGYPLQPKWEEITS
ncbi:MAG: hypothetical protein O7E51_09630, partial [Acidobacteria bacterium]|nr:hypothetical protein [Acidobacteriota bacterium]